MLLRNIWIWTRKELYIDSTNVRFESDSLSLEGVLIVPEGKGPFPAVVVCHPHPLYGGSMENNVVKAICEALVNQSIAAFKFNFRGVGDSRGSFSTGREMQNDVSGAITYLTAQKEIDPERVGLVGYSAGAAWGLAAVACHPGGLDGRGRRISGNGDPRVKALAGISPPLSLFDFSILKDCRKAKLMLAGSQDEYVKVEELQYFCRDLAEPKVCEIIEGADHFWWGYESLMAEKVAAFLKKCL